MDLEVFSWSLCATFVRIVTVCMPVCESDFLYVVSSLLPLEWMDGLLGFQLLSIRNPGAPALSTIFLSVDKIYESHENSLWRGFRFVRSFRSHLSHHFRQGTDSFNFSPPRSDQDQTSIPEIYKHTHKSIDSDRSSIGKNIGKVNRNQPGKMF